MKSFCQFILAILLLTTAGCGSWFGKKEFEDELLLQRLEPTWYNMSPQVRLANWQGEVQPHLFFDGRAEFNPALSHVNFIPLALAGDDRALELDVVSGQRFFHYFQCEQSDVWKENRSFDGKPLFTTGVIPRHFDQLNQPQKIIVFGGADRFSLTEPMSYRARIIGAMVEQVCPIGKCAGPKDWFLRMVLVGIDERDRKFGSVRTIQELQKKVDWQEVKAQMENLPGRNVFAEKDYPAIRVGTLLTNKEATDFMVRRSVQLKTKELVKVQRSCGKLYEKLWTDVGAETILDKSATTKAEIKAHADLVKKLKAQGKPTYFPQRLGHFIEKFGDELATCGRLVYPGNPALSAERFKFVSYVLMFVRLHKEGWEFSCRNKAWSLSNYGAEAMQTMKKYTITCNAREIDMAMKSIPPFLKTLRSGNGDRWRFIGWDEHAHGTHAKIEGWVKVPDRKFACDADLNAKVREKWRELPEGMEWTKRHVEKTFKDADYIY